MQIGNGLYVHTDRVYYPTCGDGIIQAGETCDDGNTDDHDLCSKTCQQRAPFVSVWETTDINQTVTLPLVSGYQYNFIVDWGDGTSGLVTSSGDNDRAHTYAEPGEYTITIEGRSAGIQSFEYFERSFPSISPQPGRYRLA